MLLHRAKHVFLFIYKLITRVVDPEKLWENVNVNERKTEDTCIPANKYIILPILSKNDYFFVKFKITFYLNR